MTGGGTLVWIVCIRVLLLVGAYHVLPRLVGEAKYVSLETDTTRTVESMTLPNVAHARTRTGSGVERVMCMLDHGCPNRYHLPLFYFVYQLKKVLLSFV